MELDREAFARGTPTLRLYSWQPRCISVGYSQEPEEELDLARAKQLGYDVVKRPTGGGIVFHNEAEITYSLVASSDDPLLPQGLIASYKVISEAVVAGLKELDVPSEVKQVPDARAAARDTLCFSYPTEFEIVARGRKLVGSAQKRGKQAILQQGSIFVRQPEPSVFSLLKKPFREHQAVSLEELLGRQVAFAELKEALIAGFRSRFGDFT
jgi:lipoate-protein ligase A